jgi:protein-export membrane protein SecD
MRRLFPLLVTVVGMVAVFSVFVDFVNPISGKHVETKLGLDLQGGSRIEYQILPVGDRTPDLGAQRTIRDIIERRVNATGVSEPLVQTQGTDRIVVELPGVSNADDIRKLIGTTGRLDFIPIPQGTTPPTQGAHIDPSYQRPCNPPSDVAGCILFSGDQIATANVDFNTADLQPGQRAIAFTLRDTGARLFGDYTASHIGQNFAIVLDGTVISAPVIQSAIPGGQGRITGSFTTAEQTNLVTVLQFGSLPFPLAEASTSSIGATLGLDFLRKSILAGVIGIGAVLIFMLVYYRLPGAVAVFALIYYMLVVLAIFRLVPVTLTLAGVAAFVLSVGMAVDANILIFERTREELRAGKSLYAAVEAGFNRAWNSIFDSNVSSLITASLLFIFGSSVIRGFALVLIIGVLTSMFTAISLSRTLLRFVVRRSWAWDHRLFGVAEDEFATQPTPGLRPREARSRV